MAAVLITGAAKRVGAALARAFAEWGYDVAIHYNRSADAAQNLARELEETGAKAIAVQADLSDAAQTQSLVDRVATQLPGLTCLVNNASLFAYDEGRSFEVETWNKQMNVNLRAPAILSRDFSGFVDRKYDEDGHSGGDFAIVNILDQKVFNPKPEFFSYSASKCALERLTQLYAIDLAPRIRVNGVAPGLTLPSGAQTQEQFDASHSNTPLGRGSTVPSMIRAVKYLIDEPVMTGQVLYLDGGERFSQRRDYKEMRET